VDRQPRSGVCLQKKWRDRLIAWIAAAPTPRVGVFIDESWFVLWPHWTTGWAARKRPRRIPKNKAWKRGERPPSCALYAQMDVVHREVSGEWHPTWNQEETWTFVQQVIADYQARGSCYLVVFWDHGPWHVAASIAEHIVAHNRTAQRTGGIHVRLFFLPIRSPWLMPLEGVFGQTKRAVGGVSHADLHTLQTAVEHRFARRNAKITHPTHGSMARTNA